MLFLIIRKLLFVFFFYIRLHFDFSAHGFDFLAFGLTRGSVGECCKQNCFILKKEHKRSSNWYLKRQIKSIHNSQAKKLVLFMATNEFLRLADLTHKMENLLVLSNIGLAKTEGKT